MGWEKITMEQWWNDFSTWEVVSVKDIKKQLIKEKKIRDFVNFIPPKYFFYALPEDFSEYFNGVYSNLKNTLSYRGVRNEFEQQLVLGEFYIYMCGYSKKHDCLRWQSYNPDRGMAYPLWLISIMGYFCYGPVKKKILAEGDVQRLKNNIVPFFSEDSGDGLKILEDFLQLESKQEIDSVFVRDTCVEQVLDFLKKYSESTSYQNNKCRKYFYPIFIKRLYFGYSVADLSGEYNFSVKKMSDTWKEILKVLREEFRGK